jgi:hypothetical protein
VSGKEGGWKIPGQGKRMCFWFIPKMAWTASPEPAITATHVNGKRGSLLGGAERGCNHVQKHKHNGGVWPLVLHGQVVKYCLGQSEGFRIIRTAYGL